MRCAASYSLLAAGVAIFACCARTDIELLDRTSNDCDLYVDNTSARASDANAGTSEVAPIETLARAAEALTALDEPRRLCVLAGRYDESPVFVTSGVAGARLELTARAGVRVRGIRVTADHVRVTGFTVGTTSDTGEGIVAVGGDLVLDNNTIDSGSVRVSVTGDDVEITGNTMPSDGTDYIAIRFFGQRHRIHANTSNGALFCWQTFASATTTGAIDLDGNVCSGSRRACLDVVGTAGSANIAVRNNLCLGDGGGAALLIENTVDCILANNVVDGSWPVGLAWTSACDTVANNLLFAGQPYLAGGAVRLLDYNVQVSTACTIAETHGRCLTDPLLVGPSAADSTEAYLPAPGSPLIDAGTNVSVSDEDLAGRPRIADGDGDGTSIADIGALERPAP